MLGISPIKWRQLPDMTIAVDWDVQHQFKQSNKQTILLGLLESAIMLQTSTLEINLLRPNFFNRAIGIINFEKPFLNFIVDTMN